jgi:hypothetical protein
MMIISRVPEEPPGGNGHISPAKMHTPALARPDASGTPTQTSFLVNQARLSRPSRSAIAPYMGGCS